MKHVIMTSKLIAIFLLSVSPLCSMPTVEVPAQDSMPAMQAAQEGVVMPAAGVMSDSSAMQAIPAGLPPVTQSQGGMPTVTQDGKTDKKDKTKKDKKTEKPSGDKKESPSILQMKELKFVDEGLKGVGKVIDIFVGPFEDFGEAIPPSISALFGPFAHLHWALIIRSMQKRIKKARDEFSVLTGKPKPVEEKKAKPEAPVDFMTAMQQEIQKKEPEQKKKLNIIKFMPKTLIKKIYDQLLAFVKKATKPIEKKSLAVAELFEPLPPIPFLVTVSDVQIALHILSLQQRLGVIEESLRNKLEPLESVKNRALKDAVKAVELDPMVAMAAASEQAPQEKKKAEEKKKKEEAKKNKESTVKLKDTKQVQSIYSAFKKLDSMVTSLTAPIEKLTKDIPAMPVPFVSFYATGLASVGAVLTGTGILAVPGLSVLALAGSLYGISQSQFSIYIRNLQQLLGKIEGDIKNYQEAKKQAGMSANDPTKVLSQAQTEMGQQDQSGVSQDGATMPSGDVAGLPEVSGVGVMPSADMSTGDASGGVMPPE